ncbi:glycosyltransferase family 2 protein [Mucilaginibacter boryungensis]|uniref:Glycosyltransferase n=1 Tax=Mucilaginibacter boryungensis TaxID=768480 RepID=A0ABR9XLQ4_9SPHI|nr:glycosyltransferase family 2 protein [Mucilaginibacter boryungensis]MBE9667888.1 glycosyltransferase [Mucilaginibacter boryungensis]
MDNKISIITAVFNGEKYLQGLIESVISQDYSNYELIIIDGRSTDDTIAVIKKYEKHIAYWISEKDNGIYDAWNKGIEKATGDWIAFLGSDDVLLPGALTAYSKYFIQVGTDFDFVCSKLILVKQDGETVIRTKGCPWKWDEFKKTNHLAHPGSLHNSAYFKQYGNYNLDFRINGDYELLLRAQDQLKAGFVNAVTVKMRDGGVSAGYKALKEHRDILLVATNSNWLMANTHYFYLVIKLFGKKLLAKLQINAYFRKSV